MTMQPGQSILNGKYHILRLIGEGGMARVWLAEEPRFGNRQVAIKEPRTDLLPEHAQEVRLRYRREVQVCAALEKARTPQIVRAITTELLGDTLLLVMEYLPGGDLAALLKEHPGGLPVERAVAIALDLLAALEAVHDHDLEIVHRDVKPSNVLFDEEGKAYLADFGLAQLAGMSGRSQLAGGQHPGTPMYMAPEQESSPRSLTPAADLYAVGCILFEMLTGKRFKRVRPGTLPGALRPEVPSWLDEVVAHVLAEDPWERYAGAAEMAGAMREAEERARAQAAEEARRRDAEERARAQAAEEARRREAEERARTQAAEEARRQQAEERTRTQTAGLGKADQEADIPASLQALVEAGLLDETDLELAMSEMTQEELEKHRTETVPSWLRELSGDDSASGAEAEEVLAEDEIPDWLREVMDDVVVDESASAPAERALEGDDIPDWLRDLDAVEVEESASAPAEESLEGDDIPDWLRDLDAVEVEESASAPTEEGSAGDDVPDWLRDLDAVEVEESASASAEESLEGDDIPDWLRDLGVVAVAHDPRWKEIGIEMVTIPAGEFLYGEEKEHIYLPEYAMAKTPVTNAQYKAFVEATRHEAPKHWEKGKIPTGKQEHPVVYVSWHDATAFCRWAGCRLPTEQEWEKAARGTDGREYPWGDEWEAGRCNTKEANIGGTTPVDRYPTGASPYGLLDMAGNVLEWCEDWHDGTQRSKVLRGGSWRNTLGPYIARSVYRGECVPDYRRYGNGFRCVGLPTSSP